MTRYELLDRIGVGGMAEIFRGKAVAAGGFEKPVAIKRILPHLSQDKRFVELLIAEAKVLSLLKHRNIVQIFDVGLGDDGQYFLVMEYVDGKDLGAVQRAFETRRRRLPFDLALHVGAEICEALEHAHTARAPDGKPMMLVHRDVSPSNVLLSRAGEIKLTDFGIAKRAESEQTGHGAVRGKFAYISPEQARNEHIDPRSDVFSVAILIWELVVNRRLFSGLGDLEALRAVREAQVPRPRDVDPRLSGEIDALLMASLDRELRNRPTAGELGAKLRSMRYALDVTVGDPATELAKLLDTAEEVQRESQQMAAQQPVPRALPGLGPSSSGVRQIRGGASTSGSFDSVEHEATVIRIRTADEFQARDHDASVARARLVIDRFDEEETRQSQLSGDQLRILRGGRSDSSDLMVPPPARPRLPGVGPGPGGGAGPPRSPAGRPNRITDVPTATDRPAFPSIDTPTTDASIPAAIEPSAHFETDESTRMLARPFDAAPLRVRPGTPPPPALPPRPFVEGPSQSVSQSASARGAAPAMPLGAPPHTPAPSQVAPPAPPLPPPPVMAPVLAPPPVPSTPIAAPPPPPPGPPPPGAWTASQLPPRGASPTAKDMFDASARMQVQRHPKRRSSPHVAGFHRGPRKPALEPWMLVVGALVMAALAFAVTRAFLA